MPGWYERPPFASTVYNRATAWLWLMDRADQKSRTLDVSFRQLGTAWNWHREQVRRFLLDLARHKLIVARVCRKGQRLTLCSLDANPDGKMLHVAHLWHPTPAKPPITAATPVGTILAQDLPSSTRTINKPVPSLLGRSGGKGPHLLPPTWEITETLRAWALLKTPLVDIDLQTEAWRGWAEAKAQRFVDWNASWRKWMAKEQTDEKRRSSTHPGAPRTRAERADVERTERRTALALALVGSRR